MGAERYAIWNKPRNGFYTGMGEIVSKQKATSATVMNSLLFFRKHAEAQSFVSTQGLSKEAEILSMDAFQRRLGIKKMPKNFAPKYNVQGKQKVYHVKEPEVVIDPALFKLQSQLEACNSAFAQIEKAKKALSAMNLATLGKRLSVCDKKTSDIMHRITSEQKLNAAEGYRVYAELREVQVERRKIKNTLQVASLVRQAEANSSKESFEELAIAIETLKDAKYYCRTEVEEVRFAG